MAYPKNWTLTFHHDARVWKEAAPGRAALPGCAAYIDRDVMGAEIKHRYTTKCCDQGDEMSVPLGYLLLMAVAGAWVAASALAPLTEPPALR